MSKIDSFDGDYRFLSNFYPHSVKFEGLVYPTSEHAFQAAKTLDMKLRKIFTLDGMTPGMAKHLGRNIPLRTDWENVKIQAMRTILIEKFEDPSLRRKLIETGDAVLIEGNTWDDTFWGVCNGKGTNYLGKLLMEIRINLTNPSE